MRKSVLTGRDVEQTLVNVVLVDNRVFYLMEEVSTVRNSFLDTTDVVNECITVLCANGNTQRIFREGSRGDRSLEKVEH